METLTLKIEKSKAIRLFKQAPEIVKEILIDTFGNKCFSENIIDRVKTFEDALSEADEQTRLDYLRSIEGYNTPDEIAYKQRKLIAKVLRGDWEPDWNDTSQRKWFPWFRVNSAGSGFAFSVSYYDCDVTFTHVGSRLCFPTEELSNYFGKQFIEIHRNFLT